MNNLVDAYFKKTVSYNYRGHNLQFNVSQALFSSQDIDIGTQRLLRTLTSEKFNVFSKLLDLGCGYGPIGIALKTIYPQGIVHMVDRDALALDYSRKNAELNNLRDIKIYSSLGYDDIVETDFDLIVSNIPAKVGNPILSYILQDAKFYLKPEGRVAVVVTDTIEQYVGKVLSSDPNINILFHKKWPGHSVFHYKFSPNIFLKAIPKRYASFDRGLYNRDKKYISVGNHNISIQTTYGMPEFDTLSYETELLLSNLNLLRNRLINLAIVFNPRQGFVPVALSKSAIIRKIVLIDRDLQAIRVSRMNLLLNGYHTNDIFMLHQVGIHQPNHFQTDCILGILEEKEPSAVYAMVIKEVATKLASNGLAMFASTSTTITRLERFVHHEKLLDVLERHRSKGKSIIILKHKS